MATDAIGPHLDHLTQGLIDSYAHPTLADVSRVGQIHLPQMAAVAEVCETLLELLYPGYFGRQDLCSHNLRYHVGELLGLVAARLRGQLVSAFCCAAQRRGGDCQELAGCDQTAESVLLSFLEGLPALRALLAEDVQAAFDGDPAARSLDEVVLCYPGLFAISVHRLAHALHLLGAPLIPRMMNEHAHRRTGIDIHPGATIGRRFFIDHGTGVVIGETAQIGDNVRVYQGVTLGGLRPMKGQAIAGTKRHPTIRQDVVISANAIILGGETEVGAGCTIGGSVFLTRSVAPNTLVTIKPPELTLKTRSPVADASSPLPLDFQI